MENEIKRGEVWYLKFNDSVGFEESVGRPAVVVSSKEGLGTTPIIQVVYMTTTPKKGGSVVELFTPKKRSWALCNQIVSVDRSRFLSYLCTLNEQEMLKIELGLRKVLALPVKDSELEEQIEGLNSELSRYKEEIAELQLEIAIHKKLYEKALDKIVEQRFEKDTSVETPKTEKVAEPIKKVAEAAEKIIVDVDELKAQMGAIPEKKKSTAPEHTPNNNYRHGLNKYSKPSEFLPYKTGDTANVNTMEWFEIVANTGMSIQLAQAITGYRNREGKFDDLVDLLKIPRFGAGCMNKYGRMLEV